MKTQDIECMIEQAKKEGISFTDILWRSMQAEKRSVEQETTNTKMPTTR